MNDWSVVVAGVAVGTVVVAILYPLWLWFNLKSRQVRSQLSAPRRPIDAILESYERQISSAEKRGDSVEANRVRQEYERQIEAWRAQQDFEIVAPREISTDREKTPLSDEALARIEKIEELLKASKNLSASLLSAEDYFLRGNANYKAERYDDALADYNRSLNLRRDHADTLNNRGVTLRHLERYDEALADFDRALSLQPEFVRALVNRGLTLQNVQEYERALADYARALELSPNYPLALYNRACLYAVLDKADEAVADLRRAIDGDGKLRAMARDDDDFANIRSNSGFQALVAEPAAEDNAPPEDGGPNS